MEIIIFIISLIFIYLFYQFARNEAVFKIRLKWINEDDKRWETWSYDQMYAPSRHNWYGIKYPKEFHY